MRRAASLGAGTPSSAHGLRRAVGFFIAYFEHRRRASTSDRRGPSQATAAASLLTGDRRGPPRAASGSADYIAVHLFIYVQHQLSASVAVIFPDHFIYSDYRG